MLLRIEHRTRYRYDGALQRAAQYVRMTPSSGSLQTVRHWTLAGPAPLAEWQDGYGNICHHCSVQAPLDVLELVAGGSVETREHDGISQDDAAGLPPAAAFLSQTRYTHPSGALLDFAQAHAPSLRETPDKALRGLVHAVRAAIDYEQDSTQVETTAAEAFARGRGVCQDHAHAVLSVCRFAGLPARYVSGYLWTGDETGTHPASHAWAEAWLPGRGWLNVDAANACIVDHRYVRLAHGRDYASAAPVFGLRDGGGTETLEVEVRIRTMEREWSQGSRLPGRPQSRTAAHAEASAQQ